MNKISASLLFLFTASICSAQTEGNVPATEITNAHSIKDVQKPISSTQRRTVMTGTAKSASTPKSAGAHTLVRGPRGPVATHENNKPQQKFIRTSAQQVAHTDVVRAIVSFPGVVSDEEITALKAQLKNLRGVVIAVASASDFSDKTSPCANTACALLSNNELAVLNASSIKHKVEGSRTLRVFNHDQGSVDRGSSGASSTHVHGTARTTGLSPSHGDASFTYTNPDPSTYYIPDLGYQELDEDFPVSSLPYISWSSSIYSTYYEVGYYHTSPSDLLIQVGYDDTAPAFGGSSTVATTIWDHWSDTPGYHVISGTTHAFDYLNPNSQYYVGAWDTVALDDGYLDYVNFDVYWLDYPDFMPYTGSGSVNDYYVDPTGMLQYVDSSIINNTAVDDTLTFGLGWYITPAPGGGCSTLTTFDANAAYFAGYNTVSGGLLADNYFNGGLSNVDLWYVQNGPGYYMGTGDYCLWSFADDLAQVDENDELNNVGVFNSSFYFVSPVAVKTVAEGAALEAYPNPAINNLTLKLNQKFVSEKVSITVTSILGQQVLSTSSEGSAEIAIDVSHYAPGSYILNVVGEKGRVFTTQFVKIQ